MFFSPSFAPLPLLQVRQLENDLREVKEASRKLVASAAAQAAELQGQARLALDQQRKAAHEELKARVAKHAEALEEVGWKQCERCG